HEPHGGAVLPAGHHQGRHHHRSGAAADSHRQEGEDGLTMATSGTMKALVVDTGGDVAVRQIDRPRPASHQALVETICGGICGTDATLLHRSFKGIEQYPLVLGHESVGRVVEVGSDVTSFAIGDVVL